MLVEDDNQDGKPDMAVFDAGVYATAESTGYGNPPQLLLTRPDVTHELSSALADAVAAHRHSLGPDLPGEPSRAGTFRSSPIRAEWSSRNRRFPGWAISRPPTSR